jgi:GMP synthase (glutamine-hydrolysing)
LPRPPRPKADAAPTLDTARIAGPSHDRLLIVDFGSQVTQLIARRLRELHVYCEIHPFHAVTPGFLREFAPKAVILSGGPASVFAEGAPLPPREVFDLSVPVLGICYGQQAMMHMLGARWSRATAPPSSAAPS